MRDFNVLDMFYKIKTQTLDLFGVSAAVHTSDVPYKGFSPTCYTVVPNPSSKQP